MRLLRNDQVEVSPDSTTYCHSRASAVIAVLFICGVSSGLAIRAWQTRSWLLSSLAAFLILGLLLFRRMIYARFRPTNWLVRSNPAGLFIQFRSYLNYYFPPDDPTIVFIAYSEIRSARLVRQRELLDASGDRSERRLRLIELELAGDAQLLSESLAREQSTAAPSEKRWYGRSSTRYQDYPVRMGSPATLQLEWSVFPRAEKFLDSLRPHVRVEAPVSVTQDFPKVSGLTREEQSQRLKQLDSEGQTIAAVHLARQLYGGSLAEAKARIEDLRKQKSAGMSRQND
jgi:hypothetical protein